MKFRCAKDVILNAVMTTSKAASSKSTIAALEGVLMELDNNVLTITGYNLEIGIRTEITVEDGENGSTVINAKMLSDIIRKMPSGTLSFDIGENNMATIINGVSELSVMCMRADEYPPVPQANVENGFTLPQKTLKSMIVQTKYACAVTDTKPALTGCLFDIADNTLNVVAVDGIRIALRREPMTYDDTKFIVPARTLDELIHLLSDENDKNVTISIEKNQISFEIGSYTMISRLINGEFMEYKKHLECTDTVFAEVKCREIIEVLDRSMLFINEKNKSPIRCEFSGDSLTVSCSTALGKINDKISVKYNGEPITIGFNAKFLLDAFKAADTDSVKLILTGAAVSPVIIVPMEGREFTFLLLPMRLK
ncbi:MAG: DNA polymerase III subunit beta [Oscillospiraceae bacterium]|nr:DNA polymerase III subunit beta [Oscillospiraceae bacterium]